VKGELRQARQHEVLSPQGTLQCSVYAVPLFGPTQATVFDRISGVGLMNYTLRYKIQVENRFLFRHSGLYSCILSEQNK